MILPAVPTSDSPLTNRRYTFEEFLTTFDGVHAEWLPDGTVEIRMGNNIVHARLVKFILSLLEAYLQQNPTGEAILQGVMQRMGEGLPAREPDLMVVLNENRSRIKQTYLDGPADIVVEIVSPESVERDHGTKLLEYEAGGVGEYWLIDPERRIADILEQRDGRLVRRPLDAQGRITSGVLAGFALSPEVFWRDPLPDVQTASQWVKAMFNAD